LTPLDWCASEGLAKAPCEVRGAGEAADVRDRGDGQVGLCRQASLPRIQPQPHDRLGERHRLGLSQPEELAYGNGMRRGDPGGAEPGVARVQALGPVAL